MQEWRKYNDALYLVYKNMHGRIVAKGMLKIFINKE